MAANSPKQTREQRIADSRERARKMQQEQLRKERRGRMFAIWGTVIAVVVVVGLVVAFVLTRGNGGDQAAGSGPLPTAANAQGGVSLTSGTELGEPADRPAGEVSAEGIENNAGEATPSTVPGSESTGERTKVVVYADFNCVHCFQFEQQYGSWLIDEAEAGTIELEYRMVGFLDQPGTSNYSSRAANAAFCVAQEQPEAYGEFVAAVFADYGNHGGQGMDNAALTQLASDHGADVGACIEDGTYRPAVAYTTAKAQEAGIRGTPSVYVNGKELYENLGEDQSFQDFVTSQQTQ